MTFNPTGVWENTKRLMGGDTSHHTATILIQMRLPSGRLAENSKENGSVFVSHFKKVLNNHKPTDKAVINNIDLREVIREIDIPPSWREFICSIK